MMAWRRFTGGLQRFLSQKRNVLAAIVVAVYVVTAIAAPTLSPPSDPRRPSGFKTVGHARTAYVPLSPAELPPLGTTPQQQDVFHSLVWGARSALRFGLIVALTSAALGTVMGAVSGYAGGWLHGLVMRVADAFLAFPPVVGVLLFGKLFTVDAPEWMVPPTPIPSILSDLGLNAIMVTLIAFSWMPYARLVSADIRRYKTMDFVMAARAVGARPGRILFRHLLPHALSPAVVLVARDIGGMAILDSAFAFFNLGGTVEWGQILAANRDWIIGVGGNPFTFWWVFLPMTLALIVFGVAWNALGDGLNVALNPRASR
jgi:peptide/nickel transport system permease protein